MAASIRGTGNVVLGGLALDRHPIVFALSVLVDAVVEHLWCSALWSEILLMDFRKRKVEG